MNLRGPLPDGTTSDYSASTTSVQLDIVYLYYSAVHHLRPSSLFDSFPQRGKNTIRGGRRNHLITEPWLLMAAEQTPVVFSQGVAFAPHDDLFASHLFRPITVWRLCKVTARYREAVWAGEASVVEGRFSVLMLVLACLDTDTLTRY